MKKAAPILLPLLLFLPGCLLTAQDYVIENSEGFYSVRGEIQRIEGLHSSKWEDLKDGFVFVVDHPGCEVTVQQGEAKRSRFALQSGDRIIHSHEIDFVLSALAPNQQEVGASPPKKAQKKAPAVKSPPTAKKQESKKAQQGQQ